MLSSEVPHEVMPQSQEHRLRDREGRNDNREYIQSVKEVGTKSTFRDIRCEFAIRGRDNANINRHVTAANGFNSSRFQNTQQEGLEVGGKLAHFIEEYSPAMCCLEVANSPGAPLP